MLCQITLAHFTVADTEEGREGRYMSVRRDVKKTDGFEEIYHQNRFFSMSWESGTVPISSRTLCNDVLWQNLQHHHTIVKRM